VLVQCKQEQCKQRRVSRRDPSRSCRKCRGLRSRGSRGLDQEESGKEASQRHAPFLVNISVASPTAHYTLCRGQKTPAVHRALQKGCA